MVLVQTTILATGERDHATDDCDRIGSDVHPNVEQHGYDMTPWDCADVLSERMAAAHKLMQLQRQVHTARTTCGSCTAWMTRGCPREVHDNHKGRSQGPSSLSVKCDKFAMTASAAASVARADTEIATIRKGTA